MTRTELLTRAKQGQPIDPIWIISGVIKLVEVIAAWIGAATSVRAANRAMNRARTGRIKGIR